MGDALGVLMMSLLAPKGSSLGRSKDDAFASAQDMTMGQRVAQRLAS